MIISASTDYRAAAKAKLPPFLFHYIDGGSYDERTLKRNTDDLGDVALRQRVLRDMTDLSLETEIFGEKLAMPIALAPVGLTGMYARRGEVQAAKAAEKKKASHLLCQLFRFVRLKKSHLQLNVQCGSSFTCLKIVAL